MTNTYMYECKQFGFTLLVSGLLLNLGHTTPICPGLVAISECACLGRTLTYQCTTQGLLSTVWGGSAFDCIGDSIVLRHSQYGSSGVMRECNNGLITAQSLSVDGDCYTSQLNVTVSSNLNGKSVECAYSGGDTIGSDTISVLSEPLPAPNDVQLAEAHPGFLTFTWSPVSSPCQPVQYNIVARNCGIMCPTSTTHSGITCTGRLLTAATCIFTFAVQTVVCENIIGNSSNPVTVTLKGLPAPTVRCEPEYSADRGILNAIITVFQDVEPYTISGQINGAASSYTFVYTESHYGTTCGRVSLPVAAACVNGMCKHVFAVSTSSCPPLSNINVTVYGINQLGNGSVSDSVTVESINYYFGTRFDLITSTVHCFFLNQETDSEKFCIIEYSPQDICSDNYLYRNKNSGNHSNSVSIGLSMLHLSQSNKFCYVITLSNGTSTAKIRGTFNAGCNQQQLTDGTLLPNNITCGAPLHTLGIKNGLVCYNGIDVGAVAVYSCLSRHQGMDTTLHVRTCLDDGSWNGTIPDCGEPADYSTRFTTELDSIVIDTVSKDFNLMLTVIISGLLGFTLVVAAVIFAIALVCVLRAKAKIQEELQQARATAVYEEIGTPLSTIDSSKNIAYMSTRKAIPVPT